MLRLAEILLEPRPATTWAQLRQLGIRGGNRRAAAGQRRLARARARAALGARAARALPAADRGRRVPAHRARGQPAHGPAPARPARPRGGARGGARADPRDGEARDRGVVLQLDAGRLVVAHLGRATRPGRSGGDRLRRVGLGRRDTTTGGARRGGNPLGDARLVPRARRPGRGGGGRQAGPPPGRPAALARSRHRPHHPHDSRPTTACSSSSRARPTG